MYASPALRAICSRHGVNLEGLSPAQIREHVPRIIAALEAERRSTQRAAVEIQKSTAVVAQQLNAANALIPNAGIIRSETLGDFSPSIDSDDPNDVLTSLIPY